MSKSAEAFRTISEVAEELGIAKHVLRFWEIRFAHIRPMKRGGGRRFYRPEDLELLRGIDHLLHREGYTIKGVQKIFREQGVEVVKERGRAAQAAAEAAETKSSRRKKSRPEVPSGSRRDVAPVRAVSAKNGGGETHREVRAAIAELEVCRDLLAGRSVNGAKRRVSAGR